jgi:hypothetical protein
MDEEKHPLPGVFVERAIMEIVKADIVVLLSGIEVGQMEKTNVMAQFVILGDKFDPQIITDNLKLIPTRCWTKEIDKRPHVQPPNPENLVRIKDSDLKNMAQVFDDSSNYNNEPRPKIKHDFSRWDIQTGYQESDDINIQVNQIYQILKKKINILNELKPKYELDYRLVIVINIEDNEKPGMCFDHYIIDFLHEIGAIIDIDMYIYS